MCYSLFLTKREREYASFPRERERERERERKWEQTKKIKCAR